MGIVESRAAAPLHRRTAGDAPGTNGANSTPAASGASVGAGSLRVTASGDNPFCGDSVDISLELTWEDEGTAGDNAATGGADGADKNADAPRRARRPRIANASFDGYACSLCTAATDVLIDLATGMDADEALGVTYEELLARLDGVKVGRTRSGCVRLPLTVLRRALDEAEASCPTSR